MEINNFKDYFDMKEQQLQESASRYSIPVDYRTGKSEVMENFARMVLGFVSSAMKGIGYHVKNLYNDNPYRIIISSRNWDDGEWCGCLLFDLKKNKFVIAEGHYNKDKRTVSIKKASNTDKHTGSDLYKEMKELMDRLKRMKGRQSLQGVNNKKRGPKSGMKF